MTLSDYPLTMKALKGVQPQMELIRLDSQAGINALNEVRNNAFLPTITVEELLLATMGRLEKQLESSSNKTD